MSAIHTSTDLLELVLPALANHHGNLFAGSGLQLMAKAAFLEARNFSQEEVVMASVQSVDFLAPIPVGRQLLLRARVNRVGNSSMTVAVSGWADKPNTHTEQVLQGVFEMVAVDGNGRPTPLNPAFINKEMLHDKSCDLQA